MRMPHPVRLAACLAALVLAVTLASPAIARAETLSVATWNLNWLHRNLGGGEIKRSSNDYRALARYARMLRADVIALQEVDGERAARRVFRADEYEITCTDRDSEQRVCFAIRHGVSWRKNPDYRPLGVAGTRYGAGITVRLGGERVRMLAVHLKSGCFDEDVTDPATEECRTLAEQLVALEHWVDARSHASEAALVLGDFNRRMHERDPFWREIDDGFPEGSDLVNYTAGREALCNEGRFPQFIDHIVANEAAARYVEASTFRELSYRGEDRRNFELSDHCAISVDLVVGAPDAGD